MADPITTDQIKRFVEAWYFALDIHAPVDECHKMLADVGLEIVTYNATAEPFRYAPGFAQL